MSDYCPRSGVLPLVVDDLSNRMENAQAVLSIAYQFQSFFLSFRQSGLSFGLFGLGEGDLR
jgi:hypothetical protein